MSPTLRNIFDILVKELIVTTQLEFANHLNYTEGYISQALNGDSIPNKMKKKLLEIYPFSKEWIETGMGSVFTNGRMIEPIINNTGTDIDVNLPPLDKTGSTAMNHELMLLLHKKDEQMDRLITVIEQLSAQKQRIQPAQKLKRAAS